MMTALEEILQRHPVWRGGAAFSRAAAVPSGFSVLDGELPGGGWPTGGLTEILGLQQGIGELRLLLPVLAALTTAGKRVIWLAPPHCGPAARILKRRGAPAAAPLRVPLKHPLHALGRSPSSPPASRDARARRSLGLPVHAQGFARAAARLASRGRRQLAAVRRA